MPMRAGEPGRQFESPDDKLLAALRLALRPEPLPTELRRRILADFDRRRISTGGAGLPRVHLAWLAAAACLTVAFVLPPRQPAVSPGSARSSGLSREDAAEIVRAFETLSWDSPLDYTLEAVHSSLEDIRRSLQTGPSDASSLPWGRDEDWDVPPPAKEGASQSWVPPEAWCRAAIDAGDRKGSRPNEPV